MNILLREMPTVLIYTAGYVMIIKISYKGVDLIGVLLHELYLIFSWVF